MRTYRTRRSGFTLVEILIVVIILGILAAIVIPQFTNASQDARKSNLASQVQTLKSQIELYKLQHKDVAPALQTDWTPFTEYTDINNTVAAAVDLTTTPPINLGPYMQTAPVNPLTNSSTVGTLGSPAATDGWTYDVTTGRLHGVVVDSSAAVHESDDGYTDVTSGALIQ